MRPRRSPVMAASALAAGLLLLVAATGGAVAAAPAVIVIEIDFDAAGPEEPFTTDSALLCESGDAFTDFHRGAGNFQTAGTFHLNKLLVCEDGSGSFVITVDAASNFVRGQGTTGGWSVVPRSGTGAYVGLRGGGHIVGINSDTPPVDLTDYYYGSVSR